MGQVAVIDYGIGNLRSVCMALQYCGADVRLAKKPAEIESADRVVLPGVGAFPMAMQRLIKAGFDEAIKSYATRDRPLLGICVGMQMLFELGLEFTPTPGLALVPGQIDPLPRTAPDGTPNRIPHVGWTALMPPSNETVWDGTILDGLDKTASVYFVHSYAASPGNSHNRLADIDYNGQRLAAAVRSRYVYGTQFHPEKSGPVGLTIIRNFIYL